MDVSINLKPLLIGGAIGAVATAILGFTWGGWFTASKAEVNAQARADTAVVAALAPICVENYRQSVDAQAKLIALGKVDTWKLASFVEEAGWAKMPGSESVNSTMARTCAELILKERS